VKYVAIGKPKVEIMSGLWPQARQKDRFNQMFGVWWFNEGHSVGSGMDEVWMGALLALCVAGGAFLAHRIETLKFEIRAATETLSEKPTSFDDLREDLEDLIADTLSQIQPPNAGDHFMGAMGQIAQMWAMRKFGADLVPQMEHNSTAQDFHHE
jgi:hypothetical protein